jgi:hypothetical protein
VRQSIRRIQASPFIPHKESVRGFIYEVETGRLREVTESGRDGRLKFSRYELPRRPLSGNLVNKQSKTRLGPYDDKRWVYARGVEVLLGVRLFKLYVSGHTS